ncbi:MAG: ROK family transcriptional regulator [Pleomorphochaeta sp.]|jgi:glucokinase-like ROK family protein
MRYKNNSLVQNRNRRKILKKVWEEKSISRSDLAKQLKITPATVSSNVAELEKMNFIRLGTEGESSGGRKPIMLEINEASLLCIGITVKKTEVVSALVNLKGISKLTKTKKYPLPITKEHIFETIIESIKELKNTLNNNTQRILGIGVGFHGIVNYDSGISIYAPAFNWRYVNIKALLEKIFKIPVIVDNDARVMVLAEKWFGKYRSIKNLIFVSLDSGVGSGILIDGKIFRGSNSAAGEIGHIRVKENGTKCLCGNYGCLDTVASTKALINDVVTQINLGYPTIITSMVDKNLDNINYEIIDKAARENDEVAIRAFNSIGAYVGTALADIVNVFNPEAIIIGGIISSSWQFIEKQITETVQKQSMTECYRGLKILKSSFPGSCGQIGAAALVLNKILEEDFL